MDGIGLALVGLAILAGIVGVVVPVLPGLLLCWAGVLVWALAERTELAWAVLAGSSVVAVASQVVKYVVPGQRIRRAGVPTRSVVAGALLGIVGFFVVPVVGLPLGFVLGVYVAERMRLGIHPAAWTATLHALRAVGLSILIELAAALLIAAAWLAAVLAVSLPA